LGKRNAGKIRIFSGNANKKLAKDICRNLGVPLGKANVSTFSDGETRVEIDGEREGNGRVYHPIYLSSR